MKVRLTKRAIDSATYQGPGTDYRWDAAIAGFGLRVYPSGRKSFVVTYRVRGKQRFLTLGRYGEMTLDQARAEAFETLGRARKGEDPSRDRRAARQGATVEDLAERYMTEHAAIKKKPKSVREDSRRWNRGILPRFGRRKVADIDRADVAKLHADLASTPSEANCIRDLLSKAFNLAELWGWRPEGSNPCRHVARYREQPRDRFLSETELARLSQVLDEAERSQRFSAHVIAAIRLLILTGCRSGEIKNLRWQDVDFERRCLHLPDSKTGPKTVLLNNGALEIFRNLEPVDGNPYVIPGAKAGRPRRSFQDTWVRIRKAAGLEDVRLHDLRHTFASFGVGEGLNLPVIGRLLGHSRTATTERYAHLADDPVRKAAERIGAKIEASMTGKTERRDTSLKS